MNNCYALLVGINDYPQGIGFGDLMGCAKDAERVQELLNHLHGNKANIKLLQNADATKKAIVDGFQKHLAQAQKGDIAFFFYSGHGSQEPAASIFQEIEGDGLLETIVCYDSRPFDPQNSTSLKGTDLSDKELRYLFHELSQKGAQVVAIFDCCNSGDNVRSEEDNNPGSVKAYPNTGDTPRNWNQFIFGDKPEPSQRDLDTFLPEAEMIQLSACRSYEFAKERETAGRKLEIRRGSMRWVKDDANGDGGVFINGLLDVLSYAESGLSYYDLAHRIRSYVQGKEEAQTPLLYASGKANSYLFQGFLGAKVESKGIYGRLENKRIDGKWRWMLDLGAVHGLPADGKEVEIIIKDDQGGSIGKAGLEKVFANSSLLKLASSTERKLNETSYFTGHIEKLMNKPTNFYLLELDANGKVLQAGGAGMKELEKAYKDHAPNNVVLSNSQGNSPYSIIARQKEQDFILARSVDKKMLPIIKEAEGLNKLGAKQMMNYLEQVAHWEYVKDLSNVSTKYTSPPLEATVYRYNSQTDRPKIKANREGDYKVGPFKNYKDRPNDPFGEYDVDLKNVTNESIFVGALLLNIDFSIIAFRSGGTALFEIGPGKTRTIPLGIFFNEPAHAKFWETPYIPSYLKLFVASKELVFDIQSFARPPIPAPGESNLRSDIGDTSKASIKEWTTQLVSFQFRNVSFKKNGQAAASTPQPTAGSTNAPQPTGTQNQPSSSPSSSNTATAQKDKLSKISGIGPSYEKVLNEAGIFSYAQLAAKDPADLKAIFEQKGGRFKRAKTASWPMKAKAMM